LENRTAQALSKLFDRHRIVFWYDSKQELRQDFEELALPHITKKEITNNEFSLKYQILKAQPDQKFLLYKSGPQPADIDNWLLDVQLAQGEFRTDRVGLWLAELELGLEFTDVVQDHLEFFQASKRQTALKKLLQPEDTSSQIRLKMLAICAGSEPRIDTILENLLQEMAEQQEDKIKLIDRCNLTDFLWAQLHRHYNYQSTEPTLRDWAIELFKSCYAMGTSGQAQLNSDALVFLKRWKDSRRFAGNFETLAAEYAELLNIEKDLAKRDFRDLLELDYFENIDRAILNELVKAVTDRTVTSGDIALWVRQRRQSHWYQNYQHLYEAIDYAAQFTATLDTAQLTMESLADGVARYSKSWYQLDQLYRKFIYHVSQSAEVSLMGVLTDQIENLYVNNYLLKINDRFQFFVDQTDRWSAFPITPQKNFFQHWVQPFLNKENKVCVIVSDALRYEIGDELLSLIRQEDRYSAELETMLSMLPSYTQLGMAALLPNQSLAINQSGNVEVDGSNSQGTAPRGKILKTALQNRADAITYTDLMAMNRDTSRELLKANDVVYIYHNRIDHTGDKIHSEGYAFEAVADTLAELVKLIKKLTAANANNILVTADHGFIYQNRAIAESDFIDLELPSEAICYRNRRFLLGQGLPEVPSLRKFTSAQLGLAGDLEVQMPKSINRLRLKGSGSRFVHGGAALQEVVIPVLKINKKRQSDVSSVEVDILGGSTSVITSGQIAVALYQTRPVTDKIQPRVLRAGFYSAAGELISDRHDLTFDLAAENPRERELQVRFLLTRKADETNNTEVFLRLEEKQAGTSHYREYKSLQYTMRRSFTSDFDF
jgi:uncharacterized protein (TIGR02687 family)